MSFQQQYLPRYQWANPYLFFPIPDTVITVDGSMLPIVARHRAYTDEAEVFATVPAIARVEGALVAIADGADTYQFYYWFINRSTGVLTATWELKPLAPISDTYEIAQRLLDSGPGWNGFSFELPPLHTLVRVAATCDVGLAEADGLGTSDAASDIANWPEGSGNFGTMEIGYTNTSGVAQTIYYNAQVYLDPNYKVIVTIRKNPFDKYPNL